MAGRNRIPSEIAGLKQPIPHALSKAGMRQTLGEQIAVHVGELHQVLVKLRCRLSSGVFSTSKQLAQPGAHVAPVFLRSVTDNGFQESRELENAGVVGEQAEQQTHQQPLQVVAVIAGRLEGVVELAPSVPRPDVDRVLVPEGALLNTEDEAESFDVRGQLGECELDRAVPSSRSYNSNV